MVREEWKRGRNTQDAVWSRTNGDSVWGAFDPYRVRTLLVRTKNKGVTSCINEKSPHRLIQTCHITIPDQVADQDQLVLISTDAPGPMYKPMVPHPGQVESWSSVVDKSGVPSEAEKLLPQGVEAVGTSPTTEMTCDNPGVVNSTSSWNTKS